MSSTVCPKCGNPFKDDFGMATCESCGEMVFVGIDGEISNGGEAPQIEPIPPVPEFAIPGEIREELTHSQYLSPSEPGRAEPVKPYDLSDIADFGNAEISQGKDGFIVYDLIISGMETKDLRIAVRDALTDKKFMWDADNVIRGTKDGVLRLSRVNPVKASLVVRRLKQLPVQVTWEQHVIVEGDPT